MSQMAGAGRGARKDILNIILLEVSDMKLRYTYLFAFILLIGAGMYGCGAGSASSSTQTLTQDTGTTTATINLTKSAQGTSGVFMDVNGDGLADQVVGAPAADLFKGGVLVYLGSANGFSTSSIELKGEAADDNFGYSIINTGDIDGDGIKDFAVGAIHAEGITPLSGAVYIYKGGNTPTLLTKLNGEGPGDKFGWSIAPGDINGDGKADVVVSAYFNSGTVFQGGAVYVYLNTGSGLPAAPSLTLYGTKGLGYSVAVGDVNGDTMGDIIADEGGKVLVWYGSTTITTTLAYASPSVTIYGTPKAAVGKAGSGFGKATAVVGDIDGDGFNDIAIGNLNRGTYDTYDNKGSVYIFKGGLYADGKVIYEDGTDTLGTPGHLVIKITGASDQDRFGSFILPVGDAVGNATLTTGGKPDFVVSAVWGDTATLKAAGKAYLFSGERIMAMAAMAMTAIDAEKEYTGDAIGGSFGNFCAITKEGPDGVLFVGAPLTSETTGSLKMIMLTDGSAITGGATGSGIGTDTGGLACH